MRLASATNSMRGSGDYNVYASETINSMNYGEAKAVLAEGISSGHIKAADPVVQELQNALRGKAAPTAAELSSREAGAKVPNAYMRVADAYYGAGNYQKAARSTAKRRQLVRTPMSLTSAKARRSREPAIRPVPQPLSIKSGDARQRLRNTGRSTFGTANPAELT